MSPQDYKEEDIELVQEIVEKIIDLLDNKSSQLIEELSKRDLSSFDNIIRTFQNIFFRELITQNTTPIPSLYEPITSYKPTLSKEIQKIGREDKNSISSGVGTYLSIVIGLFLISKGLEKYNFTISTQYFKLLAYSSLDIIDYNKKIFGIEVIYPKSLKIIPLKPRLIISNLIPLLENQIFKLGNGACPYTYGKRGNQLNQELIEISLKFLQQFYDKVLIKYKELTYKPNKVPDYVIILRGEFDAINLDHLHSNPLIFKPIN